MLKFKVRTIGDKHFIIEFNNGDQYLQSYNSIIVKKTAAGAIYLDCLKWDYSRTTGLYRNAFLGESIKETRKK